MTQHDNIYVSKDLIDQEAAARYSDLKENIKRHGGNLNDNHLTPIDIHYLFVRSAFDEYQMSDETKVAHDYYSDQAAKYWNKRPDYDQALIGRYFHRVNDKIIPTDIVRSFSERAIIHDELGMYWKNRGGYHWYELPIELHTAITQLFIETKQSPETVNEMNMWLLNHKRTNSWSTTKGTAEAIFTLLQSGSKEVSWVDDDSQPFIKVNNKAITVDPEAGTGYFKKRWLGKDADNLESIIIENNNSSISWGGVYIQYFEDLENINQQGDHMIDVKKSLYLQKGDDQIDNLIPIGNRDLAVGDMVVNRIEISTDRDMEFMHLKDMRASGLEPLNVISGFRWNGGMGYYESTKDLGTHFFFDYLPKGTYVLEYKLRVSHAGTFQNGIATLQSMYAPEFSSHSSSQVLEVK